MTRRSPNLALASADAISINLNDAHRLDISSGDELTLESAFGTATGVATSPMRSRPVRCS
jgi:predicted molibdopterin-dependent oxidoreductase YjgC